MAVSNTDARPSEGTHAGTDAPTDGLESEPQRASRFSWLRGALLIAGLAVLVAGGRQIGDAVLASATWVQELGAWGPVVFAAGYVVAVAAFVPGSALTLVAGAVFGLGIGTVTVFAAATLGSALAFVIARYLARPAVQRRVAGNARFAAFDRAIAARGARIVFLLRLSPAFPFTFLNYALGLTRISLRDYLLASPGMLPGTLLYVYYGRLAGEVAALAGGAETPRDTGYYAVLGLGLLATVGVTTWVTRIARSALREATQDAAPRPLTSAPEESS